MSKKRCDVPEKYRWDLTAIFASDDDFRKECDELDKEIDFSAYRGTLKDAEHVLAFLKRQEELVKRLEKAYCYAMMKKDEDGSSSEAVAMMNRAYSVFVKFSSETSFFTPEIKDGADQVFPPSSDVVRHR